MIRMLTPTVPAAFAPIAIAFLVEVTGGCHKGNCCPSTTVVNNNYAPQPAAPEPRAIETSVNVSYGAAR